MSYASESSDENHPQQDSVAGPVRGSASAEHPGRDSTVELQRERAPGPWLIEVGSPWGTVSTRLEMGARLVIGSGSQTDLRSEDPAVSARHVRLSTSPYGPVVEDLDSKNGLYVGGASVHRALLHPSSASFVVGRTTVVVRAVRVDAAETPAIAIEGLVGGSEPMRRLAREIARTSRFSAPVLLQGETGSGKDIVAQCIHRRSGRAGPYVPLNVGTIAESLADADLFGHRKGAFTGATGSRVGAFELAHRGTLLLDEVAELSPGVQVKLLRAVEQNEIRPVGGTHTIQLDVRLISATWAPLREWVAAGRFREDLFHRISTFIIDVPPLRRRKSDIPALSVALLERKQDELGVKELSSAALARLSEHSWPGNVRELSTVLYRAATTATGTTINGHHVDAAIPRLAKVRPRPLSGSEARDLLEAHGNNVSAAARAACVPRTTFRGWLKA